MVSRKAFATVAACATLACASLARATEQAPAPAADSLSLTTPIYAQQSAPPTPMMNALGKVGAASTLDGVGIKVGGWVEMSWTHNFVHPSSSLGLAQNFGRVYDFEDDDPTLNQVVVFIEKGCVVSGDKFDWGGRIEWMWGGDARLLHAGGLFDFYGFPIYPGSPGDGNGPDEQWDPTQFYLDHNIPIGNGLLIRSGKFVTPVGYETINPNTTPFYSRSFLFGFAIPLTHMGMMATYGFDKNWTGTLGVIRGWEQAFEDNNGQHSYLAQIKYTSEKIDFVGSVIVGPEQFENNQDWRHLVDLIVVYKEGDNLRLVLNADYGWEDDGALDGGDGEWWGAAGYGLYKVNDYLSAGLRVEYFSDHDGCRGLNTELHEITAGLTIHPCPQNEWLSGLMIRPEMRWDHATDSVFDGGEHDTQFTIGGDIVFAF